MRPRLDRLRAVARLAGQIVLETPERSSYALTTYVRRQLIADLEAALNAAGYDMTKARKLYRALNRRLPH